MLYAVANDRWTPGSPLIASQTLTGLYRTRREAASSGPGPRILAVSVRYDATRGVLCLTPPAGRERQTGWSAPAILGTTGGVTALATIPGPFVRALGKLRIRVHAGHGPAKGPCHVRPGGRLGSPGKS